MVIADNTDSPGAPDYLKYMEAGGEGGWKFRCDRVDVGDEKDSVSPSCLPIT